MPFVIISEKDAPAPPKLESSLTRTSLVVLSDLKRGKVARIEPEGSESVRGIKQSLSRIAKRESKPVVVWDIDNVVYAKLRG